MVLETIAALAISKLAAVKVVSATTTAVHSGHATAVAAGIPSVHAESAWLATHGHFTTQATFDAWAQTVIEQYGVNPIVSPWCLTIVT